MGEIIRNIYQIQKSKSYIDYYKYHSGNIFGITNVSRWELMHSNFIAWALDPKSSHCLNFYPLGQLIKSFEFIKAKSDNANSRLDLSVVRKFYDDNFILDAIVEREVEHIDLLVTVKTKEKILPIVIENKVDSKENGKNNDQTKVYFELVEGKYADSEIYYSPIYVFLFPEYNSKVKQSEDKYLRMTYQELVDNVLEPSLNKCEDNKSVINYKTYLQCLSYQSDSEKGDKNMAISSEERTVLNNFIKENKNLLVSVLREFGDDEIDESTISAITTSVRDYSTYSFNGKSGLKKNRLVLEVVKEYVSREGINDFETLKRAFPDKIQGTKKGVVKRENDISDKDKGIDGQKRYFVDDPIELSDGKAYVCTQWGKDKITRFIELATSLGFDISED